MTLLLEPLTTRPPTADDVEAVAALCELVSQKLIGRGAYENRQILLTTWYGTEQNFSDSLEGKHLLGYAPDGTLIAYLETDSDWDDGLFWFNIVLHPEHDSEELYQALRHTAEAWAQRWLTAQPEGATYQLMSQAWAQDNIQQQRLTQAGYDIVRFFKRMDIELTAPPPAPVLPEGFTIRPYQFGVDDHKIHAAWSEAMAEDWGTSSDLSFEDFMFYKANREEPSDLTLWHFAMDGEEIAGFTIARWERVGDPDTGHIRDVGVRRAYRRRGLALALLHATFSEFYRRGKARVSLGVDGMNPNGANQLYEQAGMTAVLTQYKYGKTLVAPADAQAEKA